MTPASVSAGILLYRRGADGIEVLLAHPGGPFWAKRDAGAWSIPKGLVEEGEAMEETARREFIEEIGIDPGDTLLALGAVTQKSGKIVHAWAAAGDFDPTHLESEMIELEYPRGSGRTIRFPEIDRVMWASLEQARLKLNPAQAEFIDRLTAILGS